MAFRYRLLFLLSAISLLVSGQASAQMVVGQDTLYGNEWIDYSKTYWKIKVARRDMYRVTYPVLQAGGFPVDQVTGDRFQLWVYGQEVPLYVSTDGLFGPDDYFEFYGDKNKSQLDQFLFEGGRADMLNPEVSLYTDTAVYFLCAADPGQSVLRYQEETQDLSNAPDAEPSYRDTCRLDFLDADYMPTYDADRLIRYSTYDLEEGFAGIASKSRTFYLTCQAPLTNKPAKLLIKLITSPTDHHLQIRFNDSLVVDFPGLQEEQVLILETDLPTGLLNESNAIEVSGLLSNTDRYQIAWAELHYSRTFHLSNTEVTLLDLEMEGDLRTLTWLSQQPRILYNLNTRTRAFLESSGGKISYLIYPSFETTSLAIPGIDVVSTVDYIESTIFHMPDSAPGSYIIISHPNLRMDGSGSDPVESYASYRSSTAGGQFQVSVLSILDLVDQFGYGIRMHPQSIRNVSGYWVKLNNVPSHVFLIGKGIDYNYIRQEDHEWHNLNYVSTFGFTGSDNLLFAPPGQHIPSFSHGRIAVRNANEVRAYLEKVISFESAFNLPRTVQNHAYRKRVLHLPAGGNTNETDFHSSLLGQLALKIVSPPLQAEVKTLKAGSTDPVSASEVGTMIHEMNEGLLIKCYLGHGATTTTANFAVDDPAVLDNQGRYPIVLSLGCLTGYTSTPQRSISEAFTLEPEKGSIAYIASSGYGYSTVLTNFASILYQLLNDTTQMTLGEMMVKVRSEFKDFTSIGYRSLIDQLHYHGDPAIKAIQDKLPDFTPDASTFLLEPELISSETDSLTLSLDLWNLGLAADQPVSILISLTNPDQEITKLRDTIQWVSSRIPYRFRFPRPDGGAGSYRLSLQLDPDNLLLEGPSGAEENNQLITPDGKPYVEFQILDHQPYPIWPTDFALTHPDQLTLVTYQDQSEEGERSIEVQLDTCPDFSSSFLQTHLLMGDSGIRSWRPDYILPDAVHYWRIRSLQSDPNLPGSWLRASFKTDTLFTHGWNQSHYGQFRQIHTDHIEIDSTTGSMSFTPRYVNVISRAVRISPTNNTRSRVFLDGARVVNTTGKPAIYFLSLDPNSGSVESLKSFVLSGPSQKRKEAIYHVRDEIPDSTIVVVVTFHAPGESFALPDWTEDSLTAGDNLYTILEKEGATMIRQLSIQGESPYTFAFRKGVEPIAEQIAGPGEENAFITFDLKTRGTNGTILSPTTGPLIHIEQVLWQSKADSTYPDSLGCSLYRYPGGDTLPILVIPALDPNTINPIPSKEGETSYQFQLSSRDSMTRIPLQLGFWRIVADPALRLLLETTSPLMDTIDLGDQIEINYQLHEFGNRNDLQSATIRVQHLLPDLSSRDTTMQVLLLTDTLVHPFSYKTESFEQPGTHTLITELTQPTFYGKGNRVITRIWVPDDQRPPLLQLFIDGQHAGTMHPVGQESTILVQLHDEQSFFLLQDTQSIRITLTDPTGHILPLNYAAGSISFFPGTLMNGNMAMALTQPGFYIPGKYKLRIHAQDQNGNPASNLQEEWTLVYSEAFSFDSFNLFPNPFHDQLSFHYSLLTPNTPVYLHLELTDAAGKYLGSKQIPLYDLAQANNPVSRDLTSEWPLLATLPPAGYYLNIHAFDRDGTSIPLAQGSEFMLIKL